MIKIPEEVKKAVEREEYETQKQAWYEMAKNAVKYKKAVGTVIPGLDSDTAKQISTDDIKVLPVKNNKGENTGYFAIFNIAEIDGREYSDQIKIEVPKGQEGLFNGAGRWQVKDWSKASWLRRLHVLRIWVEGV